MNSPNRTFLLAGIALVSFTCTGFIAQAQDQAPAAVVQQPGQQQTVQDNGSVVKVPPTPEKPDPLKRRLSDREERERVKNTRAELKGEYKKWLDEDVRWIITDEEAKAFKSLSNDEERDQFIEQFWLRRNPNPDSPDNEYKDEHYARIAYANEHFAAGKPGWMTDRGHIYIAYGKPDSIDSHPSGGSYDRPMEEGGGNTSTFPFEVWHYRYLAGIGDNIDIEFVDTCMCGDYHATIDRSEKDALKHVPGAGLTQYEEEGQAKKADRFSGGGLEQLGNGPLASSQQSKQFDRLDTFAKLFAPPPIKFADLDQFLASEKILTGPPFLFDVRTDYVKLTNETVMVPVTLEIRNGDITYTTKDGDSKGVVNILGRVSTMTHRVVQTFEDTVTVETPSDLLQRTKNNQSVYWKALPLPPGRYKVEIAIKDVNNPDHVGVWRRSVDVPKYDDDRLASSSLILASSMERVPTKDVGAGNFVIGNTKVIPRVPATISTPVVFHRGQNLNFWMQVYNLGINDSKKNDATIEYQVLDLATNKQILDMSELASKMNPNADQVTLEKSMPLASLDPGRYQVTIKVNDGVTKQAIAQSAPFIVEQ
ncbi:GWxTD domain-containing protein [Granulicella sp. 5B5]|uniref:GWxTD domain-containing protein n=1 Tax=Granulicella sp. 5B5 TaxID=1617967 RepID=UPI0015F723CE|nr:GWxTD domain-containing protein [Granulicella sp. 5B5]QMV17547.1 GWxTD domain-containing protein [Granulicella sp. 5B5]